MILPINLSPPAERRPPSLQSPVSQLGSDELVLIELQGWLDIEGEKPAGFIGKVKLQNGRPVFVIGHHHLEGKLVSLPKPFAVLERRRSGDDDGIETTCYDIVTIIKRKVTFSQRPVPIVHST